MAIVLGVCIPVVIVGLLAAVCIVFFRRQSHRKVHKMQIELQNKDRRYNEYIETVNKYVICGDLRAVMERFPYAYNNRICYYCYGAVL